MSKVKFAYKEGALKFSIKENKAEINANLKDCGTSWACYQSDIKSKLSEQGMELKGEIRVTKVEPEVDVVYAKFYPYNV